jgi:hypothetical protein
MIRRRTIAGAVPATLGPRDAAEAVTNTLW